MNRKQFIDLIGEIEVEYPVAEWTCEGIQVWPILKKNIFFKWLNETVEDELNKHTIDEKKSRISQYTSLLKAFANVAKLYLQPSKNIDILFASAYNYRVDLNGEFVNRYYYPIVDSNKNGKYINLEFNKKINNKIYDRSLPIIFLNNIFPFFRFLRKAKKKSSPNLEGWVSVEKKIRDRVGIDISGFDLQFKSIVAMADAYKFIFKKYRSQKIYQLCYYKNEMFALNFAANEFGIETYDIQHGGQGPLHSMYTYKNFPNKGFNTLPKVFWVWDTASANHIKTWIKPPHKVIVEGNPWIDYQILKAPPDEIKTSKKIILYTLQDLTLDPYIVQAIEDTPDEYSWWLRLHPRKLAYKQELIAQLGNATGKYEIENAVQYSLPQLLNNSLVHLSKYSGSIIEAALVKTPTIIIDPIGVETFGNYIESGDAISYTSGNADELLDLIFELEKKHDK